MYVSAKYVNVEPGNHLSSTNTAPGLPVSLFFVGMIYTSTKALQFLSVPVYTIFKNLTIVVIAYGEVLWFGGKVTPLLLLSFGLMVLSSIIAAWADIQVVLHGGVGDKTQTADDAMSTLNAGYIWMGLNIICSASYVLGTRKYITSLQFKDWDSKSLLYASLFLRLAVFLSFSFFVWKRSDLIKHSSNSNVLQ